MQAHSLKKEAEIKLDPPGDGVLARTLESESALPGHPWKLLLVLYRRHWGSIALSAVYYVVQSCPLWIIPIVSSNLINYATRPQQYSWWYFWINIGVGLLALLQNIPSATASMKFLSRAVRNVEAELRSTIARKLQRLSMGYHGDLHSGQVQSKILRDVEAIEALSKQMMRTVFPALYNTVVTLVIVVTQNASVTLFFLGAIPTGIALVAFFRSKMERRNRTFRKKVERMSGRVSEMVEMLPVTRSHGLEDVEIKKVDTTLRQIQGQGHRLDLLEAYFGSSTWVTFQVFQLACLAFTSYWAMQGRIPVGNIVMYQAFFSMIINSVNQIVTVYPSLVKGFESVDSVAEILLSNEEEEYHGRRRLRPLRGEIRFESVTFNYPHSDEPVLQDLDLEFRAGESVALVGASGCGKSTILNLVIGFYRPHSGRVLVDGVPLDEIDISHYRHHLAVVLQNNILFSGSIRENIMYGLHGVPAERLEEVVRMANLQEVVEELPDGLDTMVGEHGGRLSGGQRQRIAIARAMIRDPRIIILDEATSALDTVSEQRVQQALDRLMAGRTTLVVAHRLSTIKGVDRIIVLERGRVLEDGTYEELMARRGAFWRLERAQSLESDAEMQISCEEELEAQTPS